MTLEEGTGMADEKNRRGKLHHPVTDPLDHIQPLIYLSSVSSMYHHKEEPIKTLHFPTTDDPYFLTNVEQRSKRTRYSFFLGTSPLLSRGREILRIFTACSDYSSFDSSDSYPLVVSTEVFVVGFTYL